MILQALEPQHLCSSDGRLPSIVLVVATSGSYLMAFGHTVTGMTLLGQPGAPVTSLCAGVRDLTPFPAGFFWISPSHSLMSREGSTWQEAGKQHVLLAEINQDLQGRKQVMERS